MERNHQSINSIDMELIENQKENIQPIKSGRSAHQLNSLFKPSNTPSLSSQTSTLNFNPIHLSQQRKQIHSKFHHQINLLQLALDSKTIQNPQDKLLADQLIQDPLDLFLQYIRWTIESYPSGGTTAESNLIPLLEQVTRKFMSYKRYRQDLRYLKCWLFYSDQVNGTIYNPSNSNLSIKSSSIPNNHSSKLILNFLIHNRIGTNFSLLYLEYFKLFLPLDRLKSNLDDLFKLEQVLKFGISQTGNDSSHHQILELVNQLEIIKMDIEQDKKEPKTGSIKPQVKPRMMMNSRKNKKKIQVFEDHHGHDHARVIESKLDQEHNSESEDKSIGVEGGLKDDLSSFSLITKWDNLGTVTSNRKQNTMDPTAWKGQKLPMKLVPSTRTRLDSQQSSSSIAPITATTPATRSSKIKVFEDHFSEGEDNSTKANDQTSLPDDQTQMDEIKIKTDDLGHDSITPRDPDEDFTCFNLIDDILKSEIQSQMDSIRHGRQDDQGHRPEHYQVLKFDPLKFHSL